MSNDAAATAALTICESLLLALEENGTLSAIEIADLMTDAAEAHRGAARDHNGDDQAQGHRDAARLIERIRDLGNTIRIVRDRDPAPD